MRQLTREEALKLSETYFWKDMSKPDIAKFQFNQKLLCMPFDVFHEAVEYTVGYPVFTDQFAFEYKELEVQDRVKRTDTMDNYQRTKEMHEEFMTE